MLDWLGTAVEWNWLSQTATAVRDLFGILHEGPFGQDKGPSAYIWPGVKTRSPQAGSSVLEERFDWLHEADPCLDGGGTFPGSRGTAQTRRSS